MRSALSIACLLALVAACADPVPTPTPAPSHTPRPTLIPVPPETCGSSLQAKVDAAPSGGTLNLAGCKYTAGATISKPLTLVGATVRPPAGGTGIVVKANDVTLDGLRIIGPQGATYREGEFGITVAASASSPARRLTIRNSEVASFGKAGMWLRYVADLVIEDNEVHDTVYAGIMVISGTGGRISGNTVSRIGVTGAGANSNNAYGIALEDQGLPVSSDLVVANNLVTDVPTWHALDTHGGHRITFVANTVKRITARGVPHQLGRLRLEGNRHHRGQQPARAARAAHRGRDCRDNIRQRERHHHRQCSAGMGRQVLPRLRRPEHRRRSLGQHHPSLMALSRPAPDRRITAV